ncbi:MULTISPECIES: YheC/YheD family endospore coat-associated protein [Bacillus]|uniref:YheC/YheD family endospore coat-associated protein n=1 Tax=Bacillus TaxID=1386 RepID=UPI000BB88D67|nr:MULTISPECIES: YheC/YheD family protein [Bacillus]
MRAQIQLKYKEDVKGNGITLPTDFEKYSIHSVAFGTLEYPVTVNYHAKSCIYVNQELYEKLMIPFEGNIHYFIHNGAIHLGPLIGIFTAGFTSSMLRPIGERSLFFSKLLSMEKKVGAYAFIFGANHINWEDGTIEGFMFTEKGWCKKQFPFPHVVYDRLPNRRTEQHRLLKETREKMQKQYMIPWYNPGFFNKWEIHQKLTLEENLSRFLPETYNNMSITLLEELLSKYPFLYLKPSSGSLGLGVFKIIYNKEEEQYYCRYKDDEQKNRLQRFTSLEKMLGYVLKNRDIKSYIVQQGIPLIKVDESTVDFRVHTNKDDNGKWHVSAMAAKLSGKGSVTTHANNGGVVRTLEEIFTRSEEATSIKEKLTQSALMLSEAIDRHLPGFIGEIGFDFGIDNKVGNVWLFEANSKPGRAIFYHPKLRKEDFLTRKLSIEYAIYLTEKSLENPEEIFL